MSSQLFTCGQCGQSFSVKPDVLARYPGWTPSKCLKCRPPKSGASSGSGTRAAKASFANRKEENLTVAEVLVRYQDGPASGIFTDGACTGNPGPGGWGTVFVRDHKVIAQEYGAAEHTTNNRMELTALIHGFGLLPAKLDTDVDMWTDSELCVRTINEWAPQWAKNGWQRKSGPVKNLELVQELYKLARAQPRVHLRWIKAHSGQRWNEYADALATAYLRGTL